MSSSTPPVSIISNYALGLVFIFIVAVIWALASIVVQYLYNDTSFDAPFLLTYIGTSLFTVLLPIHWLLYEKKCTNGRQGQGQCCRGRCCIKASSSSSSSSARHYEWERIHDSDIIDTEHDDDDENDENNHDVFQQDDNADNADADNDCEDYDVNNENERGQQLTPPSLTPPQQGQQYQPHQQHSWTNRDHMIAAGKIAPVWFISNFAYNASLRYTSITSSTVLANTGSLFTFLFAVLMRDEHFSWWKVLGVSCGVGGSILTGLHDYGDNNGDGSDGRTVGLDDGSRDGNDNNELGLIWGDVLSVISAVFYGVYAVMVRVLCPHDESLMSMQLFLGYVGLWNMIALSPIAMYHIFGGNGASSSSLTVWVLECIVLKGLFDNVLSDYLWARAVVLTSATVATVGLGLTIPLAFVSDVFLGRPDVLNFQSITGAVAVLTGFVLVNMGQQKEDEEYSDYHHANTTTTQVQEAGTSGTRHRREPSEPWGLSPSSSYHDQELPELAATAPTRSGDYDETN